MGRQVNFYMLPNDLSSFEHMLIQKGGTTFIPYELATNAVAPLPTLLHTVEKSGRPAIKVYIAQGVDLKSIQLQHVSSQNFWMVDELYSPVVELVKSVVTDGLIRRGRLYYQTGFYSENGQWVNKSQDFIRWGESLLRWVRSHYVKDPQSGFYIGSHAKQAVEADEYTLSLL